MKNGIKRNEPCPCGSGKKYKECCINSINPDAELYLVEYSGIVESKFEGTIKRGNGDNIKGEFHLKVDLKALLILNSIDDKEKVRLLKKNKDNIKTIAKEHKTTDLNELLKMPGCSISNSTGKMITDVKTINDFRIISYNISEVILDKLVKANADTIEEIEDSNVISGDELSLQQTEKEEEFIHFLTSTLLNAHLLKNGGMIGEDEIQDLLEHEMEFQNSRNGYNKLLKLTEQFQEKTDRKMEPSKLIETLRNSIATFKFGSEEKIGRNNIINGALNLFLSISEVEENIWESHYKYYETQNYFTKKFPDKTNHRVSYGMLAGKQMIFIGQKHFTSIELKVAREVFRNPSALLKYFNILLYSNIAELVLDPNDWIDDYLWNSSEGLSKTDLEVNLRFNLANTRKQIPKINNLDKVKNLFFHKGINSLISELGITFNPEGIMGLAFVPNIKNKENVKIKLLEHGYREEYIDYIICAKDAYFENTFAKLIESGKTQKDVLGKKSYEEELTDF